MISYYSLQETCEILDISRQGLNQLMKSNKYKIEMTKMLNSNFYNVTDVHRTLVKRRAEMSQEVLPLSIIKDWNMIDNRTTMRNERIGIEHYASNISALSDFLSQKYYGHYLPEYYLIEIIDDIFQCIEDVSKDYLESGFDIINLALYDATFEKMEYKDNLSDTIKFEKAFSKYIEKCETDNQLHVSEKDYQTLLEEIYIAIVCLLQLQVIACRNMDVDDIYIKSDKSKDIVNDIGCILFNAQ